MSPYLSTLSHHFTPVNYYVLVYIYSTILYIHIYRGGIVYMAINIEGIAYTQGLKWLTTLFKMYRCYYVSSITVYKG